VLTLPPIEPRIVGHRVLTGGEAVVTQTDAGIEVSVPADRRDPIDTIIRLELDGPAGEIPVLLPTGPRPSLTTGKKATASNWFQKSDTYAPDKAVDGDLKARGGAATTARTPPGWKWTWASRRLFPAPGSASPTRASRSSSCRCGRTANGKRSTAGTTIGEDHNVTFAPVTGQMK
jgi:hypothetical protein